MHQCEVPPARGARPILAPLSSPACQQPLEVSFRLWYQPRSLPHFDNMGVCNTLCMKDVCGCGLDTFCHMMIVRLLKLNCYVSCNCCRTGLNGNKKWLPARSVVVHDQQLTFDRFVFLSPRNGQGHLEERWKPITDMHLGKVGCEIVKKTKITWKTSDQNLDIWYNI